MNWRRRRTKPKCNRKSDDSCSCLNQLTTCRCLNAKSDCVRRFTIRKIELQPRTNGIGYEDLVTRVLDVLFVKVDFVLHETCSQFRRARTFECDVIDTPVMEPCFLDRAVGNMCVDMN